jgi:hypothetical protein
MTTLFAVYNLKENQNTEEYDNYLMETKIPGVGVRPGVQILKPGR